MKVRYAPLIITPKNHGDLSKNQSVAMCFWSNNRWDIPYVTEDGWFPFWIRVNNDIGFVNFRTHTNFKKTTTLLQRLEICNEINKTKYMVTACVNDSRLCFDHALNCRDGLLRENFIRACRQFSTNIEMGLRATDPDRQFVLQPGQTESEDEAEKP
jgi:hypothetical protein